MKKSSVLLGAWKVSRSLPQIFSDFNILHFLISQTDQSGHQSRVVIPHYMPRALWQPLLQHPWGSWEEKCHMRETISDKAFWKDRCVEIKGHSWRCYINKQSLPFPVAGKSFFLDGNAVLHATSRTSEISWGVWSLCQQCSNSIISWLGAGPSLSLLWSHSWQWLLTLEAVTQCPNKQRKPWGALQTSLVKAAPACVRNTQAEGHVEDLTPTDVLERSPQTCQGLTRLHKSYMFLLWLKKPQRSDLEIHHMQVVQGICHPWRV